MQVPVGADGNARFRVGRDFGPVAATIVLQVDVR